MPKTLITGTFNKFHLGHRAVIDKAFEFPDKVVVGVYIDMIAKRKYDDSDYRILPYETRVNRIISYIKNNYPDREFEILELQIKGEMSEMKDCCRIVLSNGGVVNAQKINFERMVCEEQPLELVYIPPIKDELGRIISSKNILKKEIDENGNLLHHLKVTFLGTSGGSSSIDRVSAGILVEGKSTSILLDCGNETALQLKKAKIKVAEIDAIFISHHHLDHFAGLPILVMHDMMLADRKKRLAIHAPQKTILLMRKMFEDYEIQPKFHIDYFGLETMKEFNYFDMKVTLFKSVHTTPCFGFILTDTYGMSVTYTGDTSYNANLKDIAKNTNLLIHEATYTTPDNKPEYGHSTVDDAIKTAKECNAGDLALVHISMKYHGDMSRYCEEIETSGKKYGLEKVLIPSDLGKITVRSRGSR